MAQNDPEKPVILRYPFSSIVGNEKAKRALTIALTSDDIDTLLICGRKGTGKTILARSVERICPDRKVITLPLNATEEQIFGGMDLESTLKDGSRRLSDSVLIRSNKNILLMENINLVPEHTSYQVMNVAIQHFNTVEREGISQTHDSKFLLIATMDPDSGELSDHMLDRFDMCVFTDEIQDENLRETVLKRGIAFEKDRDSYCSEYKEADEEIASAITEARKRAMFSRVPDGYCSAISEICNQLNIAGHRGDISVMNVSCAIAALDGRDTANLEDLKEAASLCLEHRRNDDNPNQPPPPPEDDQEDNEDEDQNEDQDQNNEDQQDNNEEPPPIPPDLDPPEQEDSPSNDEPEEQVFSVGDVFDVIDYLKHEKNEHTKNKSGRRSTSQVEDRSGRCIGYMIPKGKIDDIALCASIRAASPYQLIRDHSGLAVVLKKEDLRQKVREKKQGNKILFMVDGSGSIGAQRRMIAVKGAILSMLKDAYQKRDEIGMAVFRKDSVEEVLPMTRSVLRAYKMLEEIPTGGRTPLIHALIKGYEILKSSITRGNAPAMVILTDGRVNVTYTQGRKALDELFDTARSMADSGIKFIIIDTETGRLRFGYALELCRALNGTYLGLEDLNADYIERSVKMAMDL